MMMTAVAPGAVAPGVWCLNERVDADRLARGEWCAGVRDEPGFEPAVRLPVGEAITRESERRGSRAGDDEAESAGKRDIVAEASKHSFPASDPPPWSPGRV